MSIPAIAVAAVLATAGNPVGDPSLAADPPAAVELAEPAGAAPPAAVEPAAPTAAAPPPTVEPAPSTPVIGKVPEDQPATAASGKETGRKEIVVEGETGPPPGDPLENVNVQTFEVVQAVDKALVEPVTHGYMKVVPKPMRDGLHNVVTNLDEPVIFLSFLLELKPVSALETVGRFVINSTIGVGGLIDVAKKKPFNQPHQANGLGYVLGYYGVKPGPFLYLPLIGSTTVRDLAGRLAELPILPTAIGTPFTDPAYVLSKGVVSAIDTRAQDDARLSRIHNESSNPYNVYRSYYLRKRQAEIDMLHGLRDNADVPVFEDEAPDLEDVTPVEKGAMRDPVAKPPVASAHIPVDEAVALAP